jgi:uncharacterized protein (TIGR03663 family)
MKELQKRFVLISAVTIVAIGFRLPRLAQRPMHADEAVHAIRFGRLLEDGYYRYNSAEYHGPTLNYLTLIPARLSSAKKLTQVDEFTLRIVPVFFGVLLIPMLVLLADGPGIAAVVFAGILVAVSPAFVFYSRYYIQEMLLVCFTFGAIACGWCYIKDKKIGWALLTGVFLGLMHATKETSVIVFGSMLLAVALTAIIQRKQKPSVNPRHILAAFAAAVVVSALFYSSFFSNPAGILDSVRACAVYFNRLSQAHIQSWYYYLKMLAYSRYDAGPAWSEAVIIILALAGFTAAVTGRGCHGVNAGLLRFIAFYTIIMTVSYSLIPYKTPWCMLGFLHGMILLAGVGAAAVIRLASNMLSRAAIVLLLTASIAHLAWQGYLANYKYYADPANPYVYAHTSTDVFSVAQRIREVAGVDPAGYSMPVDVICPDNDYWPLPWYLRCFNNVRWQNKVDEKLPASPVIIASAAVEQALLKKLYELPLASERCLYVPLFDRYMQLRPEIELRGYVTKKLWDSYLQHKQTKND